MYGLTAHHLAEKGAASGYQDSAGNLNGKGVIDKPNAYYYINGKLEVRKTDTNARARTGPGSTSSRRSPARSLSGARSDLSRTLG